MPMPRRNGGVEAHLQLRIASANCRKQPTCATCMLFPTNERMLLDDDDEGTASSGSTKPCIAGISVGKTNRSDAWEAKIATSFEDRMMVGTRVWLGTPRYWGELLISTIQQPSKSPSTLATNLL